MLRFDIITIFPKIFDSYLNESILKRALKKKLISFKTHNTRAFAKNKHKTVDDKPYGGGAGMIQMVEPILRAVQRVNSKFQIPNSKKKVIILSAKGRQFTQKTAQKWAKLNQLILISGRYEGIDERVRIALKAEEISIGPYVLTDGDVAAMAIISAITRLVPGAINFSSLKEESHTELPFMEARGLEYPHYTRPEVLTYKGRKYRVPKILLSGHHKKIGEWRKKHQKSLEK
ncbi:MAG: tRNA (guanine37-N1)-methyltransferase [Parcubacteria group bacterium Gr01-1014_30]|nr:MAG: tRNA (guanine37-N1)-methyltransferase [Parcubacteria group bacterium Gr01-1014_30]